jgi:SAM-dependent methyltransferase
MTHIDQPPLRPLLRSSHALGTTFLKRAIMTLLCPLSYVRTRELPVLLGLIAQYAPDTDAHVLDLASPQMLSCHLARTNPSWRVWYANSFERELVDLDMKKALLGLSNLTACSLDIRQPAGFEAERFDVVVSCSVFEHIVDQYDQWGDAIAAQNVASWLKPGGVFMLSVPFYMQAFEEDTPQPTYQDHNQRRDGFFFQRFYDAQTLQARIIQPSGLKLEQITYTGERWYYERNIRKRTAQLFASWPATVLLGRFFPLLSKLFFVQADDYTLLKKPYLAYIALKK